jgi:outer membrane lipoprotein-sorting protein
VNILRRLSLPRLLLLCGVVIAVGISATALASALDAGPTPPEKGLADAVHDALTAPAIEGVSARIQLTDHLLEGANLASEGGEGGQLASSPLISGASGRLWISNDGRVRLELQADKGDTQILYDGHTVSMYDAVTNTLYRYTLPAPEGGAASTARARPALRRKRAALASTDQHEPPTVAKIEEAISHLRDHANVSGAEPGDIAGQAAYTVRISPNEGGSLIGGAELSFDAVHGVPLRAAIYSSTSSAPVIELAATKISYGPVADSVFEFTPPPGVKVDELGTAGNDATSSAAARRTATPYAARRRVKRVHASARTPARPKISKSGHGLAQVTVLESKTSGSQKSALNLPEALPKVKINGATATELSTALGTLLTFERSGVRYLLVGSVTPAAIEAVARGL